MAAGSAGCVGQVGGKGPLTNGSCVDVNELGGGVVADTSGAQGSGGVAKAIGRNAQDAEIDRLGFDVLGVLGGVGRAAGAKGVVGFL